MLTPLYTICLFTRDFSPSFTTVPTYAYEHTRAPLVFNLIEIYHECAVPNPDSFAIAAFVTGNGISNLWKLQTPIQKIWGIKVGRTTTKGTTITKFQVAGILLNATSRTKLVCYDQFPHPFSPIEILLHNAGNQRVLILHHPIPLPCCNVDTGWQP